MKKLKLGSPIAAIGDAAHQNAQVSNRSYDLIKPIVNQFIRRDYNETDKELHELFVRTYVQLLDKACLSVNVCYGISNESGVWVESVWISEADDDQRVFSIMVTHSPIHPVKFTSKDVLKTVSVRESLRDKLKDIRYCHPVFIKDIRQIYFEFLDLLDPTYALEVEVSKSNWLMLTARARDGSNVVSVVTRCFADASIETFKQVHSNKNHDYPPPTIIYN